MSKTDLLENNTLRYTESYEHSNNIMESTESKMKMLQFAIKNYSNNTNHRNAELRLNKYLQTLSSCSDLTVFDYDKTLTMQVLQSLWSLMNKIEPNSRLAWSCVDFLTTASQNHSARKTLITSFQFVSALSGMLNDQLTKDIKIKLLKLIQTLTCGIRIEFPIPNLEDLMSILVKWILNGHDNEILTLALGILVNLCHRNQSVFYLFYRHGDMKSILQHCFPLKGSIIQLYVSKLVLFLDHMNSNNAVFDGDFSNTMIERTFYAVTDAFKQQNVILLRQIVGYFIDYKWVLINNRVTVDFDKCREKMQQLLGVLQNNDSACTKNDADKTKSDMQAESISLILDFLSTIMECDNNSNLKSPHFKLHVDLMNMALKWATTKNVVVATSAYNMLEKSCALMKVNQGLVELLAQNTETFLGQINERIGVVLHSSLDEINRMKSLIQLLRRELDVPELRKKLVQDLRTDSVLRMFSPLMNSELLPDFPIFTEERVNLCICVLDLIVEMVQYCPNWAELMSNLLKNGIIQAIFIHGFYRSSADVKLLCFRISAHPLFPQTKIVERMCEMQSSKLRQSKQACLCSCSTANSDNISSPDHGFAFGKKMSRLEHVLTKLEEQISTKNSTLNTADIVELYQLKCDDLKNAQNVDRNIRDTLSTYNTDLEQQLNKMGMEEDRMGAMLLFAQKKTEDMSQTIKETVKKMTTLQNELETEKGRCRSLESQIEIKQQYLSDCESELELAKQKLAQTEKALNECDLMRNKLEQFLTELKQRSSKYEKDITQKEEVIAKLTTNIADLESQFQKLVEEKAALQKLFDETSEKLSRKSEMLDNIMKIALKDGRPS